MVYQGVTGQVTLLILSQITPPVESWFVLRMGPPRRSSPAAAWPDDHVSSGSVEACAGLSARPNESWSPPHS